MQAAPSSAQNGRRLPGPLAALIVLAWFGAILALGHAGTIANAGRIGPLHPVQAAIFFPIGIFFAAYFAIPALRRAIADLALTFLVAFQGVRVLALSHINMWGYGLMAGGFAFPVGLANLAVGVLAIYTVPAVAHRRPGWRGRVVVLSLLGLAEFAMTIALAILGYLAQPMPFDPPTAPGGYADFRYPPLMMFPAFAIPFLSIVHFVTLLRLRAEPKEVI